MRKNNFSQLIIKPDLIQVCNKIAHVTDTELVLLRPTSLFLIFSIGRASGCVELSGLCGFLTMGGVCVQTLDYSVHADVCWYHCWVNTQRRKAFQMTEKLQCRDVIYPTRLFKTSLSSDKKIKSNTILDLIQLFANKTSLKGEHTLRETLMQRENKKSNVCKKEKSIASWNEIIHRRQTDNYKNHFIEKADYINLRLNDTSRLLIH